MTATLPLNRDRSHPIVTDSFVLTFYELLSLLLLQNGYMVNGDINICNLATGYLLIMNIVMVL